VPDVGKQIGVWRNIEACTDEYAGGGEGGTIRLQRVGSVGDVDRTMSRCGHTALLNSHSSREVSWLFPCDRGPFTVEFSHPN
jgi:hypothetical protein